MHLVTLTARHTVSSAFVSAFYLWLQDHILPREQMLKLEIALLAPAFPSSFSQLRSKWQLLAPPSSPGCMGKVAGKMCIVLAATQ